jgi:hypothetical protein
MFDFPEGRKIAINHELESPPRPAFFAVFELGLLFPAALQLLPRVERFISNRREDRLRDGEMPRSAAYAILSALNAPR